MTDPQRANDEILEEQQFVNLAWKQIDRRTEECRQADASGGADAHARRELRRMLDATLKELQGLGDGLVAAAYQLVDADDYLGGADSIHVGLKHVETEKGLILDWRSKVAEELQWGKTPSGSPIVSRRTIQAKRRTVTAVQTDWMNPDAKKPQAELGRVVAPSADTVGEVEKAGKKRKAAKPPRQPEISNPGTIQGGDILLSELASSHDGHMREAVATIQLDQDRAIRSPRHQAFIIEGGPGTGKTLVGLHRVAKILYDLAAASDEASVLVLGPNARFMDYISRVLPALGEHNTTNLDIASLCLECVKRQPGLPGQFIKEADPLLARVKGDAAMATLIRLVAWTRVKPVDLHLRVEGQLTIFPIGEVTEILNRARQAFVAGGSSYASAQELVTQSLRNSAIDKARETARQLAADTEDRRERKRRASSTNDAADVPHDDSAASEAPEKKPERSSQVEPKVPIQIVGTGRGKVSFASVTRQLMPDLEPFRVVSDLLTSQEIAHDVDEPAGAMVIRHLLTRPANSPWTTADLPLLDEAAHVLGRDPRRYRHVVVDEAQDLSAMAWRAIGRRVTERSITILGDLNQSTDHAALPGWAEALGVLKISDAATITLGLSYRLPKPVLDYAVRALPKASRKRLPAGFRNGEQPIVTKLARPVTIGDIASVIENLADDAYLGIITTDPSLEIVAKARDRTLVLSPDEAKGLEFDVAVVVEPGQWCDETDLDYRRLFIALSRPTKRLVVLHHKPLPRRLLGVR